jgi:hypothetical protein
MARGGRGRGNSGPANLGHSEAAVNRQLYAFAEVYPPIRFATPDSHGSQPKRSSASLSILLSVDPGIIRHREGEQRQITLSVNDLPFSCRTSYSPSFA